MADFLAAAPETIIGVLALADTRGALEAEQRRAWEEEIDVLGTALAGLDGTLFLEFDVPRLGSRIDAALVSGPAVFPIEFKCGEQRFTTNAVTWDADLRLVDGGWRHHSFRGDVWTKINKIDRQRYLLNAYRVLLTRARQGMAIFIPPGDHRDPTRLPKFYDGTFEYLRELGLPLT